MDEGNASGSSAVRRWSLIVQGLVVLGIALLITDGPWLPKLVVSSIIMLALVVISLVRK